MTGLELPGRPSGGMSSRLMAMTSLKDAKDDPSVVQMEAPTTYRKGSVSQRRESNVSSRPHPGSASFTR